MGRRGFSLTELLVGAGLAMMVATIVLSILVVGQRWSRQGMERADYQREALIAVSHLMHHLLGAREIVHPILAESSACCFQGHDFRVHVYAFKAGRRVLVHHILDPATGSEGREEVLASHVRAVRFRVGENARTLHMKMLFSKAATRVKKSEVYEVETALSLRN